MANVYILGSGFSASCGLPTLNGLLSEIMKYEREGNDDVANVRIALGFLYPHINPEKPGAYPPLEEFLSLIRISEQFGGYAHSVFDKGYWSEKEKYCLRLLTDCISSYAAAVKTKEKDAPLKAFIKNLQKGDSIITFNWDTLIETSLLEINMPFSLMNRDYLAISIFKLHGSLSWQQIPEDKAPLHPEYFDTLSEDERLLCRKDHGYIDLWDALDLPPYIIPPISNKSPFDSYFIKNIWVEAFNALVEADKIVIIGYSLPPEDLHARVLIRSSVYEIKSPLHIIDPNPAIAGRYYTSITPNIRFHQRYFTGEELKEILG